MTHLSVSLCVGVAHGNPNSQNVVWAFPWDRMLLIYSQQRGAFLEFAKFGCIRRWEGKPLTVWASERAL